MRSVILSALLLLLFQTAWSQHSGKISGTVNVPHATLSLLRAKDSAIAKLALADKDGAFVFENLPDGAYRVSVTSVGFAKTLSAPVMLDAAGRNKSLPAIQLSPLAKTMSDITVTAKRPLVEQRMDRTIVNVEASITNIGTSALDVLEKAPGVTVDREGRISLKGKEGVLVMVDGRPTQLGGADLANLLRNMNADQLDQLEIMTNPPARYDASGTSGLINIKTKKSVTAGFNGTATLTYTQGRYAKTAEGFNFNYREGKVNIYTNLGHNYHKAWSNINIDRNIFNGSGSVEKFFSQGAHRIIEGNNYNGKLGIDFFATKKTTFGAVVMGNWRNVGTGSLNTTHISDAAKQLEGVTTASVDNASDWNNISTNLNFRTLLDKKGSELTADLDFQRYAAANDQFMVNAYADAAGNPVRKADSLLGDLPQEIRVWGARVDYMHPFSKGAKFEAGLKRSVVRTDNNAIYDSIQHGATIRDVARSNHFVYEENINAAYANLAMPLSKKWSMQLGLRLENTIAKGLQKTTGQSFDRQYTQLFPTAYLQYKANEQNSFVANVGRRLRRPDYQSLNPFIKFIDRYTFSQGNPELKPSISTTVDLSHTWKNQITTALNYSIVNDLIDGVVEQKGEEAYTKPSNIASLRQYGMSVSANNSFARWWTSSMNFQLFYNQYKGVIDITPVDFAATSFILSGTQQFKITKTFTGEINGRVRSGWLEGAMRARPVAFIGVGFSQQVLKDKGSIRLSVRDIFHSQRFRGRTEYGNVDFAIEQVNETRLVSLAFTYRFSKGKKIAPVKRTAGSAGEEQERIGQ